MTAPPENYSDYDSVYRLKTVQRGQPPQTSEDYVYDAVGNRLRALQSTDWSYSNRNELLTRPGAAYDYDLNGNLAYKAVGGDQWTYEWDAEDRLTEVRRNSSLVASYIYDALGRRAERSFGAGNVEEYIYDGQDIFLSEFTSGGIPEGPLFEMTSHLYVHGPGIDEPLEVLHGTGQLWYYHPDGLGSIVRVTDQDGHLVPEVARQYDTFGNLEVGAAYEGYAFTGREWDPETGFYYYRARYYDPKIGRFISGDSAGYVNSLNLYEYVGNNPVNNTDPTGHYTVNTGDKTLDKKVHDAVNLIINELFNGKVPCECLKWFMDRQADLIKYLAGSGPPHLIGGDILSPGTDAETNVAQQTTILDLDNLKVMSLCKLAGTLIHEIAHYAGYPKSHPDDGLDKACTFGCIVTQRGSNPRS